MYRVSDRIAQLFNEIGAASWWPTTSLILCDPFIPGPRALVRAPDEQLAHLLSVDVDTISFANCSLDAEEHSAFE